MLPKAQCEATPFIFCLDPGLGPSFLENITAQLEDSGATDSGGDMDSSVIHLYPGDVPNLTSGMRAIISSFLEKGGTPDPGMNTLYWA
jgi:origin recognition complex subunit 3